MAIPIAYNRDLMSSANTSSADVLAVGRQLATSIQSLLDALPEVPRRPTAMAKQLGLSRVTCSKLLGALKRPTPFELLEAIPGPESLRVATAAVRELGVDPELVDDAQEAIDAFATLVREHFGTRAALTAALSGRSRKLRARNDQAGRFDVFNGMRRVLGVEAHTWLTAMFLTPTPDDADVIAVTSLQGALGLRRLRPDTQVYFTCGAPYPNPNHAPELSVSPISLQEHYTHEPARLETTMIDGQLRHRLDQERLGKHAIVDMLTVNHDAHGSRRYAAPDAPLRGVSLFVDVPVRTLVYDAIVHRELFPGCAGQLVVYNAIARGPANPNDATRRVDQIPVSETVVEVPATAASFTLSEVPNYEKMVSRICRQLGHPLTDFRVHRLQMAYPVNAFQFVIVFDAPRPPGTV